MCVCVCQQFDRFQRKLTNPILSRHLFFYRKFCTLREETRYKFIYLFIYFTIQLLSNIESLDLGNRNRSVPKG